RIRMGDHMIVVGRVEAFSASADGDALTYWRGRYGSLGADE
ncbi:MAG: flavin reductase, partial [Brevundimonas sp.]